MQKRLDAKFVFRKIYYSVYDLLGIRSVERQYYPNGKLWTETYYKGRRKHRKNGAAFTMYLDDGTLYSEMFYYNNRLHNKNSHAFCVYDKDPKVGRLSFYIHGQKMEKCQWFEYLDQHIGVP